MGMRVPTLIISPWVRRGRVSGQLYEHSSLLKFIERRFGLPTLASVNHLFDRSTPGTNNDAAQSQPFGPPAPPRDGLAQIGDFYNEFDFSVVTPSRGDRKTSRQHFQERPTMIG